MAKIVLVDDEPTVLQALTLILGTFGYEVEAFNDSSLALERLKRNSNDLYAVVSDLQMPTPDGFQVLEQARSAGMRAPFILVSGHATSAEVEKGLRLGANAFLLKPFSPLELKAALEEVCSAQQQVAIGS